MKNLAICILFVIGNFEVFAQSYSVGGILKNSMNEPIIGANVVIKSSNNETVFKTCQSGTGGEFAFSDIPIGSVLLNISYLGLKDFHKKLTIDKALNLGTIVMEDSLSSLDEFVVIAKMVETFGDKTVYKLKAIDRSSYSNALRGLELIPKIQVLDQAVSLMNGKSVKLLINGVPCDASDLSVMSTYNVSRIDFYENPPARYANLGLGAVINVITKQNETGGSLALNLQNAVTTGFGNDVLNFKYNWNKSQIGLKYNISYRNYNRRILYENLNYTFDATTYKKEKKGEKSPYKYENQLAEFNFTNQVKDNYIFNTKISLKSFDRKRSSVQNITSQVNNENELNKVGKSIDNDKYLRPVVDVYFNMLFNKKNELAFNLVGTYYQSN